MKIFCSKCGLAYEITVKDQGKQMQCTCGEMILIPYLENSTLFPCPDCTNSVSKNAWFCPKCGTPVNLKQIQAKQEVAITNIDLHLFDIMKLIFCFVIAMLILSFLIGFIFLLILALSGNLIK